jgi:restriction system protein
VTVSTVWTTKGGRYGEREERLLAHGLIGGGWEKLPTLEQVQSRDELAAIYAQSYPEASSNRRANHVGQLWSLRHRMADGDLVVLPLKTTGTVAVGRISGPYGYRTDLGEDLRHVRQVEWLKKDVARDAFDQDLLYSFGAFLTFGRVRREDAEARILAAMRGEVPQAVRSQDDEPAAELEEAPDVESIAREQLRQHVTQHFAGNDLARLVAAVLEAKGYTVSVSPPGPDRGVDILAGVGALGLDRPRLAIQVKTGQAGVDELRALNGVVAALGVNHGLLVAWGGFKGTVRAEARGDYFTTGLWDANDLLNELVEVYEHLSDDMRSELPLKRVWVLVAPE